MRFVISDVLRDRLRNFLVWLVLEFGRLDNKGLGNLSGRIIWRLNDCAVGNGAVRQNVRFKFCRGNLVTLLQSVS